MALASLLCLVALTMGAAVPSVADQIGNSAAMMPVNQPTAEVSAIEDGEYAQQPYEESDALETSATHHKRYYYGGYHYPHYYPYYYPRYRYSGYHYPYYY